jgi:hypothetical protein
MINILMTKKRSSKMKFNVSTESQSKDFLILGDGDSENIVFMGDLYEFRTHWTGKFSEICPEDNTCKSCAQDEKPRFRFRVNAVVKIESGYQARIFEQGWKAYSALKELNTEYPLESNVIKVSRKGSGREDTVYTFLPAKNGTLNKAQIEAISKVPLLDLMGPEKSKNGKDKDEEDKNEKGNSLNLISGRDRDFNPNNSNFDEIPF